MFNQTAMRILSVFVICGLLAAPFITHATIIKNITPAINPSECAREKFTSLKIKDVRKIIGRKLTIKEKAGFLVLRHTLKKKARDTNEGQTALGFGIAAAAMLVLGLFIPYLIIGALIAGIIAVVLGSVAKRQNPSDKKAYAATLLGWITLGAIALFLILAIIIVSSWGWY